MKNFSDGRNEWLSTMRFGDSQPLVVRVHQSQHVSARIPQIQYKNRQRTFYYAESVLAQTFPLKKKTELDRCATQLSSNVRL